METFAREHGNHDLFQTWVGKEQYDYTYDYRGKNLHYEIWAIRLPFVMTTGAILVFAGLTTRKLWRDGPRLMIVPTWGVVVVVIMSFLFYTTYLWLANSGVFI